MHFFETPTECPVDEFFNDDSYRAEYPVISLITLTATASGEALVSRLAARLRKTRTVNSRSFCAIKTAKRPRLSPVPQSVAKLRAERHRSAIGFESRHRYQAQESPRRRKAQRRPSSMGRSTRRSQSKSPAGPHFERRNGRPRRPKPPHAAQNERTGVWRRSARSEKRGLNDTPRLHRPMKPYSYSSPS
jgi:hypothetical protein